jgi:hypothetical protein
MLGYTTPGTVDVDQIRALGAVLDRYAGRNGPVFDYANEPGILYYLLNRVPGSRFYHSDVVQTQGAQSQVISDLSASRPPVVVFSDTTFGLPAYDGILQSIRSYALSEYLLQHYRPLLDVQGQLLLIRDDLSSTAPPPPAGATTSNLYFDAPACNFGDIPNFFSVPARVETQRGVVVSKQSIVNDDLTVSGWAVSAPSDQAATEVLAATGSRVIAFGPTGIYRSDVAYAMHEPGAIYSGFSLAIPAGHGRLTLYALNQDGSVSPLTPGPRASRLRRYSGTVITTPDGVRHAIVPSEGAGTVDVTTPQSTAVYELIAPSGVAWASNSWVRISTARGLKNATVTISDQPAAPPTHRVAFATLAQSQKRVSVEVGSCLQWHGFGGARPLYLVVNGSLPRFQVSLIH